jgi:hypothetical protein
MLASIEKAESTYEQLPTECKAPTLKPSYVIADSFRDKALQPRFYIYEENDSIYYHAFHISAIPDSDFFDIQTPYGYGGPVISSNSDRFANESRRKYMAWCKENKVLVEFIRFHPLLGNYSRYHGNSFEERETVAVDLHLEADSQFRKLTKRRIAIALNRDLVVEEWNGSDFLDVFPPLYRSLMTSLNADPFYLFRDDYFNRLMEQRNAAFLVCRDRSEVLAAVLLLESGDIVEYHLGASSIGGKKKGAMYLLLREAIAYSKRMQKRWLHLGGGTNNDPHNSLLFFKTGFSDRKGIFRIGKHVYDPEAYCAMQKNWEAAKGQPANRVLFYRF